MSNEECENIGKKPGCKEELTVVEFIELVERTEEKSFGIVLTPADEKKIADRITDLEKDLEACKAGR